MRTTRVQVTHPGPVDRSDYPSGPRFRGVGIAGGGRYDGLHIMAGRETSDNSNGPEQLPAPQTPATDSDLNELLGAIGSQVKAKRRENKLLSSHNRRLAIVLSEQGVAGLGPSRPMDTLVTPQSATATDLARELIRRLEMLEAEAESLRAVNARLTELVRDLNLPAWRIEETRVGTNRLVPGPRAFIRRRRS